MTPLLQLSELARSFFSLWTLFLCVLFLFGGARAVLQKRLWTALWSLSGLAGSCFLWQTLFDVHLFGDGPDAAAVSLRLCALPVLVWAAVLAALTAAAVWTLHALSRREKRSVTPAAVKQCLDSIPCGVGIFDDDGRVLFSNVCMNRLAVALTGERLLDGKDFGKLTAGKVLPLEGRQWRFRDRDITLGTTRVRELIAADVTAEYAGIEALRKDQAALSRLNRALRDYTLSIDETVRRQEILQAKVRIHDEMNRLMLSTAAVEHGNVDEENKIFSLWEQNALLLGMDAEPDAANKDLGDLEAFASALKIRLVFKDPVPPDLSGERRHLFLSAAREALANAAKHAGAENMEISFSETQDAVGCAFTSDGRLPAGEVRFTGGLYNLSALAEKQGAKVRARVGEGFTLSLLFPKTR